MKSHGDGLFIGRGLNLGTQSSQSNGVFFRTEVPIINTFAEFVGAYFKHIQPLSNFDMIGMCKKLKIHSFRGCFMRDDINGLKYSEKCKSGDCFVMNTDDNSSPGTPWTALNVSDGTAFHFDSYGLEPTMEIKKHCNEPRFL